MIVAAATQLQALLPTLAPEAKRWLHEAASVDRATSQQQRQLKELGRFAVRSERARADAVTERARLHTLAQAQAQQLQASARSMQALRTSYEEQKQALQRETDKSRALERGLRAMARSAQPHE